MPLKSRSWESLFSYRKQLLQIIVYPFRGNKNLTTRTRHINPLILHSSTIPTPLEESCADQHYRNTLLRKVKLNVSIQLTHQLLINRPQVTSDSQTTCELHKLCKFVYLLFREWLLLPNINPYYLLFLNF